MEVIKMPDYRKLYVHLAHETEKAIRILIKAQEECEEMYVPAEEPEITAFPGSDKEKSE